MLVQSYCFADLRPCLHEVGDTGLVGFLLFCDPQSVKTKETNPTRPGYPTPRKQALNLLLFAVFVDVAVVVKLPINENGKKTKGLDRRNKSFARTSRSFVHYFAVIARR